MEVIVISEHPRNMYELLHQGALWRDARDVWHKVTEMDPAHRLNVSKMLLKRAEALKLRSDFAMMAIGGGYCDAPFDQGIDFGASMADAMTWMTRTPLYRSLVAGLPEGGSALADLRRRASHHHMCPMARRVGERPHGAACTCRKGTPKEAPNVAAD